MCQACNQTRSFRTEGERAYDGPWLTIVFEGVRGMMGWIEDLKSGVEARGAQDDANT